MEEVVPVTNAIKSPSGSAEKNYALVFNTKISWVIVVEE